MSESSFTCPGLWASGLAQRLLLYKKISHSVNIFSDWEGPHCEVNVDECERQPCVRGTCQDTDGSFNCLCDNTGYEG